MFKRSAAMFAGVLLLASPLSASADTISDLRAQIAALLAQVAMLQGQTTSTSCVDLSSTLTLGSSGGDVSSLQKYLTNKGYFNGETTGYYGFITAQAVGRLQLSLGIVSSANDSAYGIMGPRTRAAIACGGGSSKDSFSATPTSGTAPLSVRFSVAKVDPRLVTIDFGDGTKCSADSAHSCNFIAMNTMPDTVDAFHHYDSPGTYVARLLVSDGTTLVGGIPTALQCGGYELGCTLAGMQTIKVIGNTTSNSCTTAQANRGKNEQTFECSCPANVATNVSVWGNGKYTDDSNICAAAVHAGVISAAQGGTVSYTIKPGLDAYFGSTEHGVTTMSYGPWQGSFVFGQSSAAVTVIAPYGGERWEVGKTYTIKYSLKNVSYSERDPIMFYLQKGYEPGSTKTGVNSSLLIGKSSDLQNDKDIASFSYTVPSGIGSWPGFGNNFSIKVCANGCRVSDESNGLFSIASASQSSQSISVVSTTRPNITFSYTNLPTNDIQGIYLVSANTGTNVASSPTSGGTGSGTIVMSEVSPGGKYFLRVLAANNNRTIIESLPFEIASISNSPTLSVLGFGGQTYIAGDNFLFKVNYSNAKVGSWICASFATADNMSQYSFPSGRNQCDKTTSTSGAMTIQGIIPTNIPAGTYHIHTELYYSSTGMWGMDGGQYPLASADSGFVNMLAYPSTAPSITASASPSSVVNSVGTTQLRWDVSNAPSGSSIEIYLTKSSGDNIGIVSPYLLDGTTRTVNLAQPGQTTMPSHGTINFTPSYYAGYLPITGPLVFILRNSNNVVLSQVSVPLQVTSAAQIEPVVRTASCAPNFTVIPSRVYGTDIYTDDSDVCSAALHAGVVTTSGGMVTYQMKPGQSSYAAQMRNGIQSQPWSSWTGSFSFTSPKIYGVNNTYNCRANFPVIPSRVFGTDIYTDDSDMCSSALHAGAITRSGGLVTYQLKPGQSSYTSSVKNDVQSQAWGSWTGSFSFTVLAPTPCSGGVGCALPL